ncbi:MAG: hypothetical protein UV63_C0054G0007 [Microgenomates group bacterium GW2011_GWC1_43_11]|uniref:GIY-YIG domain-containing protein n=1 Tax=Candidatus Gottesmanbacteria bacterium GW2011_GWB1_44_11c TaxID=1618447 RepID=A0A0G1GP69_9BACT|nr:MAG: hypothetical protein UV63_C0054G0007 [Microgenomates group bacterium GW2011_GWC1_43_11]KKT36113.1 MAG: hypothetical protein UW22_C0044G0008 [Candidatus Gottesmanbacteria bacterium GW2011_GWB1_44_11c]HBA51413.1 hypothetical protein [Candidatus Uhrbacteria bacterium]HCM82054.1 hypothetical protein [Patescibacteria group bacterium]
MILNWIKCGGDQWCDFFNLNLNHSHFDNIEGVYIIWHGAPRAAVVYVGQGNIRDRIAAHRTESAILHYRNNGLFVTWAQVTDSSRNGVERYLANTWNPLVGSQCPYATPIAVNSPW